MDGWCEGCGGSAVRAVRCLLLLLLCCRDLCLSLCVHLLDVAVESILRAVEEEGVIERILAIQSKLSAPKTQHSDRARGGAERRVERTVSVGPGQLCAVPSLSHDAIGLSSCVLILSLTLPSPALPAAAPPRSTRLVSVRRWGCARPPTPRATIAGAQTSRRRGRTTTWRRVGTAKEEKGVGTERRRGAEGGTG